MLLGPVAHVVFWVVLLAGAREMGLRKTAIFVLLWVAGYAASGYLAGGGFLFVSWVAVLDLVLVLLVFGGDVKVR